MTELAKKDVNTRLIEPSSLSGHYLREFSRAIASMEDFQAFIESLRLVVGKDPFLDADVVLGDPNVTGVAPGLTPDFNILEDSETVVPVTGEAGQIGYLKLRGRRDSQPFGAEDMHLMGSIAGFISALTLQAQKFRRSTEAERVLKYLINQLPLGVVCLNSEFELIVASNLAVKTLGETGLDHLLAMIQAKGAFAKGRVQGHIEVENRLIYTEARRLKVSPDFEVTAFVLYDLSHLRKKFFTELELEAYRAYPQGGSLTLALVKHGGSPGACYREMMVAVEKMQREDIRIRPLDAYSTACVFIGQRLRSARNSFSSMLSSSVNELKLGFLPVDGPLEALGSVFALIDRVEERLLPAAEAFLPGLIVLDTYPAVYDSLSLITSGICKLDGVCEFDEAVRLIRSGLYDGLFMDIDSFGESEARALKHEAERLDEDFKIFFCTCQKPAMVRQRIGADIGGIILGKPFSAQEVIDLLRLQLNLA